MEEVVEFCWRTERELAFQFGDRLRLLVNPAVALSDFCAEALILPLQPLDLLRVALIRIRERAQEMTHSHGLT